MQSLNKRLNATRKILDEIPIILESLTLMSSSSKNSDRVVGHAVLQKGKTAHFFNKDLNKIMRAANLKGLTVADYSNKIKDVIGETSVTGLIAPNVENGPYESEASFFVQGNIYQNPKLVEKVVEFAEPSGNTYIVEGFAGAGNFTLALAAKGARIDAVESNPSAVRSGIKNITEIPSLTVGIK
jgi:tRNA/tmRNA/rRNA uracil-C5-methylase (TrmA/RlmC/RlmD family)